MPEKRVVEKARALAREGRSPSTQAGEFVREEIEHIREGKHGARSAKQAIAIGLSKARRAGVKLPLRNGVQGQESYRSERKRNSKSSARRSSGMLNALKKEGSNAASPAALSRHAHLAAKQKSAAERKRAARKAVRTKGFDQLHQAAQKAARTRKKRAA